MRTECSISSGVEWHKLRSIKHAHFSTLLEITRRTLQHSFKKFGREFPGIQLNSNLRQLNFQDLQECFLLLFWIHYHKKVSFQQVC
jgi:hypothetical protein